jgi:hypothetical protein
VRAGASEGPAYRAVHFAAPLARSRQTAYGQGRPFCFAPIPAIHGTRRRPRKPTFAQIMTLRRLLIADPAGRGSIASMRCTLICRAAVCSARPLANGTPCNCAGDLI